MDATIHIDKKFIKGLKEAYAKAVQEGKDDFTFNGHEFVTQYAKYFLQYHAPRVGVKFDG